MKLFLPDLVKTACIWAPLVSSHVLTLNFVSEQTSSFSVPVLPLFTLVVQACMYKNQRLKYPFFCGCYLVHLVIFDCTLHLCGWNFRHALIWFCNTISHDDLEMPILQNVDILLLKERVKSYFRICLVSRK